MKPLFEELKKGNLPGKGKKGEKAKFRIEKEKKYYFLYKNGNPSSDQLIAFDINDAKNEKFEARCKKMFKTFGYVFDEKTRKWNK